MKKSNNWIWNVVIFLTITACTLAFGLHYKNWVAVDADKLNVRSGIYAQEIPFATLNAVEWVPKLPQMKRKNGFSWLAKEKGVFKDSINGQQAYVFVDNLRQQKLQLRHSDSLLLYLNLEDSLETDQLYQKLLAKLPNVEQ